MTTETDRVRFDPRTALLVVDMQNDFADPKGTLYVQGAERLVTPVNALVDAARRAGAFVIYTQDWHPPTTPHFRKDGGIWPVHCVRDTWGARFVDDLVVDGPIVKKGTGGEDGYSGFTMRDPETSEHRPTELERQLREHGIDRVVIAGVATDYCVKYTSLDALRLGFDATVIASYVAAVNLAPGDGQRALEEMREAGVEVS